MIINFHDRAVEICEVQYGKAGDEGAILCARYMDNGEELSGYELDIIEEIYPNLVSKCFKERVAQRLENLFDNGY